MSKSFEVKYENEHGYYEKVTLTIATKIAPTDADALAIQTVINTLDSFAQKYLTQQVEAVKSGK